MNALDGFVDDFQAIFARELVGGRGQKRFFVASDSCSTHDVSLQVPQAAHAQICSTVLMTVF